MSHASPEAEAPHHPVFRALFAVEDGLINLVFFFMTLLPVLEIATRKLLSDGIAGSSVIVESLTLWAGFIGVLVCTREGKHLSLSTAELLPAGRPRAIARIFTHAVSAVVVAWLAWASYELVKADSEGASLLITGVPEWWREVIMPAMLGLVVFRLIYRASPEWIGRIIAGVAVAAGFLLARFQENPEVLRTPLAILIFVALLAGAPIYIAMSGISMVLFFTDGGTILSVPTEMLRLAKAPSLPAIPLLTAAGYILSEGGAAKRLVRLCRAWIGWLPGGTAVVVCLVCAVFTAFTGGSGVTILALGGLMLPILLSERYPEGFSLGLVTSSGSLGLLFPPSIPVILYCVVAHIPDANHLFIAGLVPGILMVGLVCLYGIFIGVREKTPVTRFDLAEGKAALWEAKWELILPVAIVVMMMSGFALIVEAAAVAVIYAAVVEVFVFKDIRLRDLPQTVMRASALVGAVLIVLGAAFGLTAWLVDAEIPNLVIEWMKAHIASQFGFLLVLNIVLLVIGSVVEIYAAIVILAPLVAPLGEAYGVDKIHLAVVFLANLELGFLFPPVGLNLFLSATRFDKPLPLLYRYAFPFLCVMAFAVMLVTYVPAMTVGVLGLFGIVPEAPLP